MIAIRCEVSDYSTGEHGETCLNHVRTRAEAKAKSDEFKVIDKNYADCIVIYSYVHYDNDEACPECGFSPNMDIPF